MPSQEASSDVEGQLFEAMQAKDLARVREILAQHPTMNINCLDKDQLTPLQHACHTGQYELAELLVDHGAGVNFTQRKDNYTPLMFAAISGRADIVRLLLEKGVDISLENCVNRTAAQMAAFVGQTKIVASINSWVSYESSVLPYTKRRELEDKPRIPSRAEGRLLHSYIVYPSRHPVKLLLHILDNLDLVKYGPEFIYVLENLSSKALKPPINEESLSLRYHFLAYLIEQCLKAYKSGNPEAASNLQESFDTKACEKIIESIIRRLVRREDPEDIKLCTPQLDRFILDCIMKFPYTQTAIFKTTTFALTRREVGEFSALTILTDSLNGPRTFSQPAEACSICGEVDKNKKCSKCKSVYYCGPLCQKADWFQHKKVCRSPEETPLLKSDNSPNDVGA